MSHTRIYFVLTILFCLSFVAKSQNQTAKTTGSIWYYEYLPPDYNLNSNDYPVVIFFHGLGERGNDEASLNKVAFHGPPKLVKNGTDFPFILISPQLRTNYTNWPPWYMDQVVEHVKTYLRIDLDRIYVTGLSLGGGGAWFYAHSYPDKIAAVAPVCGSRNNTSKACLIAAENVPVWAFHGDADGTVSVNLTINYVNAINNCVPTPDPLALMTIYPGVGHNAWDRAYRNDNSLHTPNIYEWMMAQTRSSVSADAGADQQITLPTNSVNLTGSGTSNVAITSYLWEKVSGPVVTLANQNTSTLSATNMIVGNYIFRFTITDANGASASDEVAVDVVTANLAPIANAGIDKTIKLPVNSVSITGTGSDVDGTIASYLWTKISGGAATIGTPNGAFTNITNLVVGTYVFELTVTDDDGATGTDEVTIIVQEADNLAPTANAGTDKSMTLPTNSVNIVGSGSDSDGSIASYLWEKVSGGAVTMNNTTSTTLQLTNLLQGTYIFRLTVTDDDGATGTDNVSVTVSAANLAPSVNAGSDQSITLPTSSTNISGSASDSDGTVVSYLWEQVSGPSASSIANSTNATCTVSALSVAGNYVFSLTATDDDGATGTDQVTITVNSLPVNEVPVVNAGTDKFITLPTNVVNLNGSATDSDGTVTGYQWTKISGGTATLTGATTTTLTASNLVAGSYTFRLTATDNQGATGTDDVVVTVAPAAVNESPTANAGADQVITLPAASAVFTGSGTDSDGTISSYSWTKLSGPDVTLGGASTSILTVTNLLAGNYSFELTVTDDDGAIGSDIVLLTVNNSNSPPVANAGTNKTITLPTNSLTIVGTATDADGSIQTITWTQESGPSVANFSGANTLNFFVTNLINGLYTFRLTVIDDDGATHFDDVNVTVNAAANDSPSANAGTDKSINLPTNSINLTGTANDSDGTIASILWTLVSGPSSVVFTNENTLTVSVASMVEGTYIFRLTVTDDDGAVDFDDVTVTVIPQVTNIAPTANAGANQSITLPVNSVVLNGSGSDSDGSIAAYNWIKIAGPAATLTNASTATLTATGLVEGTYTFRLTVTDDDGAQGTDEVSVSVQPMAVNQSPTANAGSDIQLILPTNSVNLSGSGSDPDGTVTNYLWTQISGPSATLTNSGNPTLTVSDLVEGTFVFRLTVTDNLGSEGSDDVTVTVSPMSVNQDPVANAGPDKTITLPTNSATVSGAGNDPDGTISSYSWTKTSGGAATLTNQNTATLSVTGLIEGTYQFTLLVQDNQGATHSDAMSITVFPVSVNQPPVVNAGVDKTIQIPTTSTSLTGTASDMDGTIVTRLWTKESGGTATIGSPANLITNITGLSEGTYVFRLSVTDNGGSSVFDEATVTVLASGANVPPTANAGQDRTIELPDNSITLTGVGTDTDGTIASYLWTKTSGPTATLAGQTTANLALSDLIEGTYTFRLRVTDNSGATGDDLVNVTVLPDGFNQSPSASAGPDITIELPANQTSLNGTATDDGTIVSTVWTNTSGPSTPTLSGSTTTTLSVSDLIEGTYIFEFVIEDDGGLTASDIANVIVLPENVNTGNTPPTVDAGEDKVLPISENTTILNAFGSDPDGIIEFFAWIQIDGPTTAVLQPLDEGAVIVSELVVGTYTFQITVTDSDGATATDLVSVTVTGDLDAVKSELVFSPNGDGINDFWIIENNDKITECKVTIFDRSGTVVYESTGYNNDWDGSFKGRQVPEGVYFYVVRCQVGVNSLTGSITLLR